MLPHQKAGPHQRGNWLANLGFPTLWSFRNRCYLSPQFTVVLPGHMKELRPSLPAAPSVWPSVFCQRPWGGGREGQEALCSLMIRQTSSTSWASTPTSLAQLLFLP